MEKELRRFILHRIHSVEPEGGLTPGRRALRFCRVPAARGLAALRRMCIPKQLKLSYAGT